MKGELIIMANTTANEDTITIYKSDKDSKWYWNRKCKDNGDIVGASSQGYHNKSDCEDNAERQFIKCSIVEKK